MVAWNQDGSPLLSFVFSAAASLPSIPLQSLKYRALLFMASLNFLMWAKQARSMPGHRT
jgi:hypothetical protein